MKNVSDVSIEGLRGFWNFMFHCKARPHWVSEFATSDML